MSHICTRINLPPLLPQKLRLMRMLENPESTIEDLSQLIVLDPVLTSKLLKVSNSAFFGMKGKISNLDEAIIVIGTANVRSYVLSQILMGHVNRPPWNQLDLKAFWAHALGVAVSCRLIASKTLLNPAQAFSVGLMHSLGVLELMSFDGKHYIKWSEQGLNGKELAEVEQTFLLTDHAEAGEELLRSWQLPEAISRAIGQQYQPPAEQHIDLLTEALKCAHTLAQVALGKRQAQMLVLPIEHIALFQLEPGANSSMLQGIRAAYASLQHMMEA